MNQPGLELGGKGGGREAELGGAGEGAGQPGHAHNHSHSPPYHHTELQQQDKLKKGKYQKYLYIIIYWNIRCHDPFDPLLLIHTVQQCSLRVRMINIAVSRSGDNICGDDH